MLNAQMVWYSRLGFLRLRRYDYRSGRFVDAVPTSLKQLSDNVLIHLLDTVGSVLVPESNLTQVLMVHEECFRLQ